MKTVILLLSFVVSISHLCLAQTQVQEKDPVAVSILRLTHEALGGTNLSSVRDLQAQYATRENNRGLFNDSQTTLKALGRSMWRTDAIGPEGTVRTVFNGRWMKRITPDGQLMIIPTLSSGGAGNWIIPSSSILGDWERPDIKVVYMGAKEGGAIQHIQLLVVPDNPDWAHLYDPIDVYLDSSTYLPVKMSYAIHPPTNLLTDFPVEVTYSEYSVTSGLALPSLVTISLRGTVLSEHRLVSLTVNPGNSETEFRVR